MRSVKYLIAAGAASLFSTVAFAADMPIMAPPAYVPVAEFGGWYLRGDIGFSNQNVKNVVDTNSAAYNNLAVSQTRSFSSAGIYGGGVGYQFNNWFRADVTGQYRGKSNFSGIDVVAGTGPFAGFVGTDVYTATKSEVLFLANGYIDLGTWWYLTPFVGAGVGTARVSISNFTDTGDFINGGQVHSLVYAGTECHHHRGIAQRGKRHAAFIRGTPQLGKNPVIGRSIPQSLPRIARIFAEQSALLVHAFLRIRVHPCNPR